MQDPKDDVFNPTDKVPGFLTLYATAGVEEDKAETFSFLFTRHDYLRKRAERDRWVRAKVARMKALLKEFCPSIDGGFWRRLHGE